MLRLALARRAALSRSTSASSRPAHSRLHGDTAEERETAGRFAAAHGADQYAKLETWHRWPRDRELCRDRRVSRGPAGRSTRRPRTIVPMEPDRDLRLRDPRARRRAARTSPPWCRRAVLALHPRARPLPLMDIRKKQRAVVDALEDVKGRDIVVFNVARLPAFFERVVIASGDSNRQVKALADHVQEKLQGAGRARRRRRGQAQRRLGAGGPRRHRRARDAAGGAQPLQPGRALGRQASEDEAQGEAASQAKPAASAKRSARRARLHVVAVEARLPRWAERPATSTCAAHAARLRGEAAEVQAAEAKPQDPRNARLVALDERGKDLTTRAVRRSCSAKPTTAFVIGGADGLDAAIKKRRRAAAAPVGADAAARAGAGGAGEQLYRAPRFSPGIPTTANEPYTSRSRDHAARPQHLPRLAQPAPARAARADRRALPRAAVPRHGPARTPTWTRTPLAGEAPRAYVDARRARQGRGRLAARDAAQPAARRRCSPPTPPSRSASASSASRRTGARPRPCSPRCPGARTRC